ncbi:MAG: hypothetical protein AB2A00_35950 [Myxococcota bacterium]
MPVRARPPRKSHWSARAVLTALALWSCEPEPELAVSLASLREDAPPEAAGGPTLDAGTSDGGPKSAAELLAERLEQEITSGNALQKARELESELDKEIGALEARLSPVEVELEE